MYRNTPSKKDTLRAKKDFEKAFKEEFGEIEMIDLPLDFENVSDDEDLHESESIIDDTEIVTKEEINENVDEGQDVTSETETESIEEVTTPKNPLMSFIDSFAKVKAPEGMTVEEVIDLANPSTPSIKDKASTDAPLPDKPKGNIEFLANWNKLRLDKGDNATKPTESVKEVEKPEIKEVTTPKKPLRNKRLSKKDQMKEVMNNIYATPLPVEKSEEDNATKPTESVKEVEKPVPEIKEVEKPEIKEVTTPKKPLMSFVDALAKIKAPEGMTVEEVINLANPSTPSIKDKVNNNEDLSSVEVNALSELRESMFPNDTPVKNETTPSTPTKGSVRGTFGLDINTDDLHPNEGEEPIKEEVVEEVTGNDTHSSLTEDSLHEVSTNSEYLKVSSSTELSDRMSALEEQMEAVHRPTESKTIIYNISDSVVNITQ